MHIFSSFGGVEFPPVIYFKIFVRNFNGALPKYVNGKTMINSDVNVCDNHPYGLKSLLNVSFKVGSYRCM
jgi:hypothetical protein